MLEGILSRLLNGAVWGLGAALAMSVARAGGTGLRPAAKTVMKAYVVTADRVQEMTAEARESIEDMYAEVRAEQEDREEQATNTTPKEETRAIPVRGRNRGSKS